MCTEEYTRTLHRNGSVCEQRGDYVELYVHLSASYDQSTNRLMLFIVWINYSSSKDLAFGEMQWRLPFIVQLVFNTCLGNNI